MIAGSSWCISNLGLGILDASQVEEIRPILGYRLHLGVHCPHHNILGNIAKGVDDREVVVDHGRGHHTTELDLAQLPQ